MTTETKILAAIGLTTVIIMAAGIFFLSKPASTDLSTARQVNQSILVKPDSSQSGPLDAKVTLVEFGDFQCPACAQTASTIKTLKEEFKGKVNFVFRHYPLPQHKNAISAAMASEAAGEQSKFWEMHDVIYANQTEWSESEKAIDFFVKYAKNLSLDTEKFKKALTDEKFKPKILRDEADGGAAQIRYTPTLFINGKIIEGSSSYDILKSGIETELNKN